MRSDVEGLDGGCEQNCDESEWLAQRRDGI